MNVLTACILIPLAGAVLLALRPTLSSRAARVAGALFASVPLVLLGVVWARFDPAGPRFQQVIDIVWIPAVGAGFRLGVDGISLPIATVSALLFVAAVAYPLDHRGKAAQYAAWVLFLEAATLGLFLALDLLLFYVCFDLSLVGMYFLVAIWGHADRERAALTFLLYTLAGSLVMLLGILSLVLARDPVTFDMRLLMAEQRLAGDSARAGLTLLAVLFGLAVKTPLVPVHTWLPAAHVEAPAPVSALLAGVLLKMGTYGMIRVAYAMMQDSFRQYAPVLAIVAVVSIVYGALVALGQGHIKRRIAYTSVTHMGYTVLGIAAAASLGAGHEDAMRLALNGATLEMVAHALITGALFFLVGSLWQRGRSFEMDDYGGLASCAPRLTAAMVVAAFASLGLPGLAGFVAEFQIFSGALAVHPWLAGVALIGVVITAALFLQLLQAVFFGRPRGRAPGQPPERASDQASDRLARFTDLDPVESAVAGVLLLLTVVIGVAPAFILDLIDAATTRLLGLG